MKSIDKCATIAISGWYGNNNVGDETILFGILTIIDKLTPRNRIVVFSDDPKHTIKNYSTNSYIHWPTDVKRNLLCLTNYRFYKYFYSLIREIRKIDIFILGGGGLFQHDNLGAIPFWISKIAIAQILGKKSIIYAIGAKRSKYIIDNILIKICVNKADYITARDFDSIKYLKSISRNNKSIEYIPDPAFNIDINKITQKSKESFIKNNTLKIGIVLLPLWSVGINTINNKKQEYFNNEIRNIIEYICERMNVRIYLIVENYKEDIFINEYLYKKFKNRANVHIIKNKLSVKKNIILFNRLNVLISMRLHPIITSALVSNPIIGIIAHSKVENILKQLGQEKYGIKVDSLNRDVIYNLLNNIIDNYEQIVKQIKSRVIMQKDMLNKMNKKLYCQIMEGKK